MKTKIVMCCLLLAGLCGTARAGENMLANPNFELDANGEVNTDPRLFSDVLEWNQWGDAALASSDHPEAALHCEPGVASIWTDIITGPIEADTVYYLECDIKSLSGAGAKAGLVIEDDNWSNDIEILVDAPDSGEWERVYISVDTSVNPEFVGGGVVVGARSEANVELNPTGSSLVAVTNFYFGKGRDIEPDDYATNVYPPDGGEYIPPSAVLEWGPPVNYDPNAYDVYLSGTDPNANKPEHLVVDGDLVTTYNPPGDLGFNTTYYWRVNSYDPCCTDPCNWPYEGFVWSFTTMPAEPVFTTDAAHTVVAVGGSAEFSVVSPNATLGFKWYKEPATLLSDGDDGGDISIVSDGTSSTLTISDVEQADEDFYYCVAENSYDTTESTHAKLEIAALLAHWTLDSPLVADQYVDETGNHDADPNKPSGVIFTGGKIDEAVEMNDHRWANAGSWRPNEYGGQMTVSAWVKVPDTSDITGDGQGIVSKRVGNDFDWALYVRGGDGSHDGENYVRFTSWNGGDVWAGPDAVDPESPDWVYVVATVDSDGAGRLYIDGVVQAVDDEWIFGTNESADMLIGKGTPTDYVFPGLIDDVKIYNYARDPYIIAADYTDVAGGNVCVEPVPGDYNGDCKITLADVAELGLIWRNCNIIPASACP